MFYLMMGIIVVCFGLYFVFISIGFLAVFVGEFLDFITEKYYLRLLERDPIKYYKKMTCQ